MARHDSDGLKSFRAVRTSATKLRHVMQLLVLSSLATAGWGQKNPGTRPTPAVRIMAAQAEGSTSVWFSSTAEGAAVSANLAGQGDLSLGVVSHESGSRVRNVETVKRGNGFVVKTRFSIHVATSTTRTGSATLLASLAFPEPVYVVSVDGVRLQTTPQILDGKLPVGVLSQHRLEIEVPATVTEKDSQFHNSIMFQAIPN